MYIDKLFDENIGPIEKINIEFPFNADNSPKPIVIVGENGSGKTTLIKLLLRLYDVTEGEILLNGVNIKEYEYESYIKIFSPIFQDFQLHAYSIKENISFFV